MLLSDGLDGESDDIEGAAMAIPALPAENMLVTKNSHAITRRTLRIPDAFSLKNPPTGINIRSTTANSRGTDTLFA